MLDALSLLTEVADELVVRSVRDTHDAWADRFGGYPGRRDHPRGVRRGRARAARRGRRARQGRAPPGSARGSRTAPRGRFVRSAVNGLIGDRLVVERPRLAITMAVRADGRDVPLDADGLAAAFPDATGRVVVFLHGLCENESYWDRWRERTGTTYAEMLAGEGWTPVFLRANTGLGAARERRRAVRADAAAGRRPGRCRSPGSRWSATRWAG